MQPLLEQQYHVQRCYDTAWMQLSCWAFDASWACAVYGPRTGAKGAEVEAWPQALPLVRPRSARISAPMSEKHRSGSL